ncbi:MAG: hypothetical protein NUV63_12080 [Gallionella sp.]|nr:hypothetical protein [Gallionella sp.]
MKLRDESKPVRNFPSYKVNPNIKICQQCGTRFVSPLLICSSCVDRNSAKDEQMRTYNAWGARDPISGLIVR